MFADLDIANFLTSTIELCRRRNGIIECWVLGISHKLGYTMNCEYEELFAANVTRTVFLESSRSTALNLRR